MTAPPTGPFPVTHSLLSTTALTTELLQQYSLDEPLTCTLIRSGLNDTYLVQSPATKYILRVYRARWRTLPEILYELDFVKHLTQKGVGVSIPVARRNGELTFALPAPEGARHVVLFTHAPGECLDWEVTDMPYYAGQATAFLHTAADDFTSPHPRFALDLAYLIDTPMAAIGPLLWHRPADWGNLRELAEMLRSRITELAQHGLNWGPCHGDISSSNLFITDTHATTFFDFDCCGMGWRAFEIGGVQALEHHSYRQEGIWANFLKGYMEVRPLRDIDVKAAPLFAAVVVIWSMGLHSANVSEWGLYHVSDKFFDFRLTFLRKSNG